MTFQELTDWYLGLEKVKSLAYYPTLKINLASFNAEFGFKIVSRIKPADIENYQARRQKAGHSDNYVDHEVGAAKAVVNKAFDNDMVSGETVKAFKRVKKLLKQNANARDRILSLDEFTRLMEHSPWHIKAVLATGFYTGMRRGEILSISAVLTKTLTMRPKQRELKDEISSDFDGVSDGTRTHHPPCYMGF